MEYDGKWECHGISFNFWIFHSTYLSDNIKYVEVSQYQRFINTSAPECVGARLSPWTEAGRWAIAEWGGKCLKHQHHGTQKLSVWKSSCESYFLKLRGKKKTSKRLSGAPKPFGINGCFVLQPENPHDLFTHEGHLVAYGRQLKLQVMHLQAAREKLRENSTNVYKSSFEYREHVSDSWFTHSSILQAIVNDKSAIEIQRQQYPLQ